MRPRNASLLVAILAPMLLAAAGLRAQAAAEMRIDMPTWRAAAAGEPLVVELGGTRYPLLLTENPLLTEEAVAHLEQEGVNARSIRTYGGTVDGFPDSVVRVTLTDDWAAGYAITGERTLEILPTREGSVVRFERRVLPAGQMIDYEPGEVPGMTENHQFGCTSATPHKLADPTGLSNGWSTKTLSMAVAVDAAFTSKLPDWAGAAVAITNGVDGIFEPSIGVDISIVDLHAHTSGVLTSTDAFRLLGELKTHYDEEHSGLAREDVALYTGKDLDGGVLGLANCIGGAGKPNLAYQLGQAIIDPFTFFGVTFYSNAVVKTNAHELGHIFNAHHHYANCVEASRSPLADACTLMINFVDFLDEKMGSLERLVMRGWAEDFI